MRKFGTFSVFLLFSFPPVRKSAAGIAAEIFSCKDVTGTCQAKGTLTEEEEEEEEEGSRTGIESIFNLPSPTFPFNPERSWADPV